MGLPVSAARASTAAWMLLPTGLAAAAVCAWTAVWMRRATGLTPAPVRAQGGRRARRGRSRTSSMQAIHPRPQSLDLLLPANARLPLPLIVRVHGGGFSSGDKAGEESGTAAKAILAKGYALASVNYRLSGEALFPAGAQDVKAAVRWLRAHAARIRIGHRPLCVLGESAGGFMAVMIGVTGIRPQFSMTTPWAILGFRARSRPWWTGMARLTSRTMDSQQTAHPPASCPSSWLQHTPASSPEGNGLAERSIRQR